jgi:hypothetical protein
VRNCQKSVRHDAFRVAHKLAEGDQNFTVRSSLRALGGQWWPYRLDAQFRQLPDRSAKRLENWSSGTAYQFAQSVKVPDNERAAPGIQNPGGAPEGELFIDRLPAGADHVSQIVLRY